MGLNDVVGFEYLNDNNEKISVTATVKDLIDDWYGECTMLGGNDCRLCKTNVAGVEFTDGLGGDATIEDLMEFLVKETGYSEPRIDEKSEDLLKYYDAGLVIGLNKDGSNKMSFETKGEVDTIDMLAAIIEGYAIEHSKNVREIIDEIRERRI